MTIDDPSAIVFRFFFLLVRGLSVVGLWGLEVDCTPHGLCDNELDGTAGEVTIGEEAVDGDAVAVVVDIDEVTADHAVEMYEPLARL